MTKNKKNKSKSTNQKTVSKAARALGFKNIKEAKAFLNTPDKESAAMQTPKSVNEDAACVDTDGFKAVQEELAALMLDPCATDEYIVERTKYLISKHKNQNASCCAEACEAKEEKTADEHSERLPYHLFVVPPYHRVFDNYTITVSI